MTVRNWFFYMNFCAAFNLKKQWPLMMLLFGCLVSFKILATETITIATYHLVPPFGISNDNESLSVELQNALNAFSAPNYYFELKFIPRKRLERIMTSGETLIMPWVNPLWFKQEDQQQWLWSTPIIDDCDVVVTHRDNLKTYSGLDSLLGQTLVLPSGFRFPTLTSLIEAEKIKVIYAPSELNAAKMLNSKFVEYAAMGRLVAHYLQRQEMDIKQLTPAIEVYQRRITISGNRPDLLKHINEFLKHWKSQSEFPNILKLNQVESLATISE